MSNRKEAPSIGHVIIKKPTVFDLTRIINAQKNHADRVIKCVHRDGYGRKIDTLVHPNNQEQIAKIMSPLNALEPESEPIDRIIVYRSSSRRR